MKVARTEKREKRKTRMKRQAEQHTYGEEFGDHEEEDPGLASAAREAIGG